jgi:mono/diheme cytochrome c family protein
VRVSPLRRALLSWSVFILVWGILTHIGPMSVVARELPDWLSPKIDLTQLKGTDQDGHFHRLSEGDSPATVLVFLSTQCPISNSFIPELNSQNRRCGPNGVRFFGVISDPYVTRAEAARHHEEFKLDFPVLFDSSRALQKLLRPTHSPQAVLVSRAGRVVYSGRINNLFGSVGRRRIEASVHDLRDAINSVVAGKRVSVAWTQPIGCPLEALPKERVAGDVTFNRNIAPILLSNCAECHRPRQPAPFSLLTYRDATAHALQIVELTRTKRMPPWHPERGFGHFKNERGLSESEIELIARWQADGMPEGDAADKPLPPQFSGGWRLGTPDLILRMNKEFILPPGGKDVHQHFVLPAGTRSDRLIEAIEFRPGNPRIVHHASFYLDTSGAARRLAAQSPDVGYGGFAGPGFDNVGALRSWLPGMTPQRLPQGFGRLLPAKSDVVLEIHYRPSGKRESDRSTLGIHFANNHARQLVAELQILNASLAIPAGENRHMHIASYTVPVDAILLDTAPHMHFLGREMKATATRPDGSVEPLIWIKDWDFNWQGQYLYAEPIKVPAGTRIDVHAWYDNSASNPLNPNSPPKDVRWGDQSSDEMGICHFRYSCHTAEELERMNAHFGRFAARQQQLRVNPSGNSNGDGRARVASP